MYVPNLKFYSINQGNQDNLICAPNTNQSWFEETAAKYSWDIFNFYDNLFYAYMDNLYMSMFNLPQNLNRSESEIFSDCTHGQKLFWTILIFDGDLLNGGIFQFFWNRAEFVFAMVEVFDELKMEKIKADYLKCLDEITGLKDVYLNRTKVKLDFFDNQNRRDRSIKSYSEQASNFKYRDLLDYYYDEEFEKQFRKSVVDYIDAHRDQFSR
jgi:hypothetical protein